jgi:hypothetical protein
MLESLETDYLIVGAGAMGMAFADEIMAGNPRDQVVLVDKQARPGGHWNDAYSFVSLHQPAAYYGVNSETLGSGGAALASGVEVLAYYERVLRKWLASGRLRYFPLCESLGDAGFRSVLEPERSYRVQVRKKTVDATYMNVQVPSTRAPRFEVSPEATLVPLNELPRLRGPQARYGVIGAGKTGMDAVLFLLEQGIAPSHISWIMPHDAWWLDRAQIQPGSITQSGVGSQTEILASAQSLKELFEALEAHDRILRLDSAVWPTKYRCATVSRGELKQLRRIEKVVRMGRVVRIEANQIVLEDGCLPTTPECLHVDCTADGLAKREIRPVFEGSQITLQSLFMCQQVFSAAVVAHVEGRYDDDAIKNELCQVVPHPEFSRDFVVALRVSGMNLRSWGKNFGRWLRRSRLCMLHHEPLYRLVGSGLRERRYAKPAAENLGRILAAEFPGQDFS